MWLDPPSSSKAGVAIGGIVKETKLGKTLIVDDEGKVGTGVLLLIPPLLTNTIKEIHLSPGPHRAQWSPAAMKGHVCLNKLLGLIVENYWGRRRE